MFKHYTMNQVVLPLDLEIKLQENDIAYTIHELVESIPDEAFEGFLRQTGRPAYHPRRKYIAMNDKIMLGDRNNPQKRFQAHFFITWNLSIYYFG